MEVVAGLVAERHPVAKSWDQLRSQLRAPPLRKLPLTAVQRSTYLGLPSALHDSLFDALPLPPPFHIQSFFGSALTHVLVLPEKDELGSLGEAAIIKPLRALVPRFTVDRNRTHFASTHANRPEVAMEIGGAFLFRGEEDCNAATPFFVAHALMRKLTWRYGSQLPFVLAYAACGQQVRLYALPAPSYRLENGSVGPVAVSEQFDLMVLDDRLRLLIALFNVARALPAMEALLPPTRHAEFTRYADASGDLERQLLGGLRKTVDVFGRAVHKRFYGEDADLALASVCHIYEAVAASRAPNVVHLLRWSLDPETARCGLAVFGRVGVPLLPTDVLTLLQALRDVAEALVGLHAHSPPIVVRDIHWGNIMYDEIARKFFLIDLDEAHVGGLPAPSSLHLRPDTHAPEIGLPHDTAVDIWSMGKLLQERMPFCCDASPALVEQLNALRTVMCSPEPSSRPSASCLLEQLLALPPLLQMSSDSRSS